MAPVISPKKSWEGFAGSLRLLRRGRCLRWWSTSSSGDWWVGVLLGLIAVVMATLGDLCESVIKRDLGIKDMSQIIPGHGGLMDRLDSLLATIAPIWLLLHYLVFYLMRLLVTGGRPATSAGHVVAAARRAGTTSYPSGRPTPTCATRRGRGAPRAACARTRSCTRPTSRPTGTSRPPGARPRRDRGRAARAPGWCSSRATSSSPAPTASTPSPRHPTRSLRTAPRRPPPRPSCSPSARTRWSRAPR